MCTERGVWKVSFFITTVVHLIHCRLSGSEHWKLSFLVIFVSESKLHVSSGYPCRRLCCCTGFYMILTDVLQVENSKSTPLWLCQLSEYYSHQCPPIHSYVPLYIMYSNWQGHSKTWVIMVVWRSSGLCIQVKFLGVKTYSKAVFWRKKATVNDVNYDFFFLKVNYPFKSNISFISFWV